MPLVYFLPFFCVPLVFVLPMFQAPGCPGPWRFVVPPAPFLFLFLSVPPLWRPFRDIRPWVPWASALCARPPPPGRLLLVFCGVLSSCCVVSCSAVGYFVVFVVFSGVFLCHAVLVSGCFAVLVCGWLALWCPVMLCCGCCRSSK